MLTDLTIKDFLSKVSGSDPVPGGGSISALNAAIAASLTAMVANLTLGRKKYAEVEDRMKMLAGKAELISDLFLDYVNKDAKAYELVFSAYKLPKETEEEKAKRSEAIQKATKHAAEVPMEVARSTNEILNYIEDVARNGNSNAVTDACVAMMCARTAILGALLNVRINLSSIKDEDFVKRYTKEANELERAACKKEQMLLTFAKETYGL